MEKKITQLDKIHLVGITVRTNNASEMNPESAKIGMTMQRFFGENLAAQIQNTKNPDTTFCVYTNYESDFTGDYTYFIGKEVTSFEGISKGLETLFIPSQNYVKFTNQPGSMPEVVIDMWQKIWQMESSDLGSERAYIADFEVYDERSTDSLNAVLDIYIGIKK